MKEPRGLGRALLGLFTKPASVIEVKHLAKGFYLVTLQSADFRGVQWTVGQKLQIAIGSGFTNRTYTPIDWNTVIGTTRLLGYAHGDGPGSDWLRGLQTGDICDVFGPRSSLRAERLEGPLVVFGDETSIGLAYALRQARAQVQAIIEVDDIEGATAVAAALSLREVDFTLKSPHAAHLADVERRLETLAADGAAFVLTGNAQAIQRLHRRLKTLDVPASRVLAKAYWAAGKTGLD